MTKPTKPNNEWEKEFDKKFELKDGALLIKKYNDFASDIELKDFISKTIQQQREDYEFTRKEIIDWLHEQNWKCEQLEKLLIQPKT